ncbi:srpr [Symbiodinium sp. CCMP2592]|nr:srpr [Symbiodinium sp. CCMP2592]
MNHHVYRSTRNAFPLAHAWQELVLKGNFIQDASAGALFQAWIALHSKGRCSSAAVLDTVEAAVLTRWRKEGTIKLYKLDLQYNLLTRKGIRDLEGRRREGTTLLLGVQRDRRAVAKERVPERPAQEEPSLHAPSTAMAQSAEEEADPPAVTAAADEEELASQNHDSACELPEVQKEESVPEAGHALLPSANSLIVDSDSSSSEPGADLREIDVKMLIEEDVAPCNPDGELRFDVVPGEPCWAPFACAKPGACSLRL